MKRNFLWFDEKLWSSLCAGSQRRWHTDGFERRGIQGDPQPKQEGRSRDCNGKAGIQLVLIALFLMTSVLGCNMFRGAGQDMESAGKSIQRTADHND